MGGNPSGPQSPSSPWVNSEGDAAHPDSPLGGGGPGFFRKGSSLGREGNDSELLPHPQSPASRYTELSDREVVLLADSGVPVEVSPLDTPAKPPPVNPPPATVPQTLTLVNVQVADLVDLVVKLQVLADRNTSLNTVTVNGRNFPIADNEGETILCREPDKVSLDATWDWKQEGNKKVLYNGMITVTEDDRSDSYTFEGEFAGTAVKLLKVTPPIKMRSQYTVQSVYGHIAKPTDPSSYGRGTTTDDKNNHDTTLGFHEACHRNDFLTYLQQNKPPFDVKLGMTMAAFQTAFKAFYQKLDQIQVAADTNTEQNTDEVGIKRSQYRKKKKP